MNKGLRKKKIKTHLGDLENNTNSACEIRVKIKKKNKKKVTKP